MEAPLKDNDELQAKLTESLKRSSEKGYHGNEDNLDVIPELPDQISELQLTYPTILKYWDDTKLELDNRDDEAFWRKLALERFRWI